MIVSRCPRCNSVWVCWNWIHSDLNIACELNPHMTREALKKESWIHECWNCGDDIAGYCFATDKKVTNGVPYWLLRFIKGKLGL